MSFRVDLWNGFNIIKNQFSSTINKISNLYNVLLSYAGCEKVYSKSLESLYKDNKDLFKDEDYLLDKNLIMLINNFKSESEFHREHYKYVKHNILVSLKEIADKEKSLINNLFNEGIQNQENFIKTKNNIISKQKNYNSALKDFYDFLSNFKEYELNILLENDNVHSYSINITDKMNNIKIANTMNDLSDINLNTTFSDDAKMNKQINKREKLIEKIRQSKDDYTSLLNESNEYLESYKNKNENILQTLEEKYQSLISNIYSTLITTVDNRIDLINKINLLYNSYLEKNLKNITVKNETMEFIIKNATKDFPLNKFEFISNKFENNKLSSIDINSYLKEKLENEESINRDSKRSRSRKNTDVKNFNRRQVKKKNTGGQNENASIVLENPLNNDIKNYKIKSNIYLIEDFIEELIIDQKEEKTKEIELISYSDSSSKMMEISNIKLLLDKKNECHIYYLENFFKALNLNRAKGNFVLDKKSYDILVDLFSFLLNNQPNVDFILKNIIILSQTFYSLETNKNELNLSNEKKTFLQNGLKNHPMFNNPETWHRVINFNLSSNVNSRDISLQLDKNEINKKLSVLAYNTLMSYLTDIKYFTDDKNVFEEVKNFYIRLYNLNAEALNKQINDIMNYEPEPKKKKKGVTFTVKK